MVRKRQPLSDMIAKNMQERSIGEPSSAAAGDAAQETQDNNAQTKTKGYKNTIISVRFDEGDYERLKEIAQEQGTNGAALIRKAVKDIIKAAGND